MKAFGFNNPPVFGVDYDVGWAGFTFYPEDVLSEAIAYGERWERNPRNIHPAHARAQLRWRRFAKIAPVSHAFICTGKNDGIEAHMQSGVARFDLRKYSGDEKCRLYFRKPKGWTPRMGNGFAAIASRTPPLYCQYDLRLIWAMSMNYTFAGHVLNVITRNGFKTATCKMLSQRGHFICSMTVASIYRQWYLDRGCKPHGCLKQDPCTVDPQQLFDDEFVFDVDTPASEMLE